MERGDPSRISQAAMWVLVSVLCFAIPFCSYSCFEKRNITQSFSEHIFPVEDLQAGKQGYMDINGDIVIEPIYDIAYEFQGEYAKVTNSDNWVSGLIDKKGNIIFSIQYNYLQYYPESNTVIVGVEEESTGEMLYGCFKSDGSMILPIVYRYMGAFMDGKVIVQKTDYHWYIIDKTGSTVNKLDENIKFVYANMYPTGYIAFSKDGNGIDPLYDYGEWMIAKWGFLDNNGNILFEIDDVVSDVTKFDDGRMIITKFFKEGYQNAYVIDTQGNVIADIGDECNFWQYNSGFINGIACGPKWFTIGSGYSASWGAINRDGEWIIEPKYAYTKTYNGIVLAEIDDSHYEIFDNQGNLIRSCDFPCTYYNDGYLFILKNDRFYMQDIDGNTIMQLPEGYIPARRSPSTIWDEWAMQHKD